MVRVRTYCRMLLVAAVVCAGVGCAKTSNVRVGAYTPGTPSRVEPVQLSGKYTIRYRPADSNTLRTVEEDGKPLKLPLYLGDAVGFRTTDDGTLVALLPYGKEKPIPVPADARQVHFATRVREQTDFGRKVEAATVVTAGVGVRAAAVVGGFIILGELDHQVDRLSGTKDLDEAQRHGFDNIDAYHRWQREHPQHR